MACFTANYWIEGHRTRGCRTGRGNKIGQKVIGPEGQQNWSEGLAQLEVESPGRGAMADAVIQPQVEFFRLIQGYAQPASIGVFEAVEIEVLQIFAHITHIPECYSPKPPE